MHMVLSVEAERDFGWRLLLEIVTGKCERFTLSQKHRSSFVPRVNANDFALVPDQGELAVLTIFTKDISR
jgi:hypothetical protein